MHEWERFARGAAGEEDNLLRRRLASRTLVQPELQGLDSTRRNRTGKMVVWRSISEELPFYGALPGQSERLDAAMELRGGALPFAPRSGTVVVGKRLECKQRALPALLVAEEVSRDAWCGPRLQGKLQHLVEQLQTAQ